jgi:hypothetical protein
MSGFNAVGMAIEFGQNPKKQKTVESREPEGLLSHSRRFDRVHQGQPSMRYRTFDTEKS